MKYATKKAAIAAKLPGQKVEKANPMQAIRDAHYGLKYNSGWILVTK